MKVQVVYRTNTDFDATYERINNSHIAFCSLSKHDEKRKTHYGNIVAQIKETGTKFNLSPKGRLQITWKSIRYKISDEKIIKNLLVPKEGEKLIVEAQTLQPYFNVHYPQKTYSTKFNWCDRTHYYEKMFTNPYLSKKERKLLQHKAKIFDLEFSFFNQTKETDESSTGLFGTPLVLVHKTKRKNKDEYACFGLARPELYPLIDNEVYDEALARLRQKRSVKEKLKRFFQVGET